MSIIDTVMEIPAMVVKTIWQSLIFAANWFFSLPWYISLTLKIFMGIFGIIVFIMLIRNLGSWRSVDY